MPHTPKCAPRRGLPSTPLVTQGVGFLFKAFSKKCGNSRGIDAAIVTVLPKFLEFFASARPVLRHNAATNHEGARNTTRLRTGPS